MIKQDKKELRQQIACEWLENNYLNYGSLRHDIVTDRLQIRDYKPTPSPSLKGREEGDGLLAIGNRQETWRNLTDKDINTMVCNCVEETLVNISVTEMWTALKSDRVPSVHPIREWLNALPPYTPDQPDWIDFVASQVKVRESAQDRPAGYRSAQVPVDGRSAAPVVFHNESTASNASELQCSASETNYSEATHSSQRERSEADRLWRACFKKWFVAMVASWMHDEVVNHTALVLVGRQGIFKTTWLERLIPPALRAYSSKMPLNGQISKDDRLRLCENAMLNIDELDAICGREMNIVKSLLTSTDVNERAAYGRLKERRMRLASFCASTNNREFLTDITGNRRWLPFEVESIQNPFHITLPYERIYAQAKALIEGGTYMYWYDLEDIAQLEKHNEDFRAQENEEQLLPILFDIPAEGKGEFMTTAQISERLVTYGNIKKPLALSRLGIVLGTAGFRAVTRKAGSSRARGWIVYQRDSDEINTLRRLLKDDTSQHDTAIY